VYPRPMKFEFDSVKDVDYKKVDVLKRLPKKTQKHYAVIGCGFLGRNLVDQLLARGETSIKILDMVEPTQFKGDSRVSFERGNITKYEDLRKFLKGVDICYTTAALIRFYHRLPHQYEQSHNVNVLGTENIIKACIENNVTTLICTSSAHAGIGLDSVGLNMTEDAPVPTKFVNHYCATKYLAETRALQANGSKTANGGILRTGVIRPASGVFGNGDALLSQVLFAPEPVLGFCTEQVMDYVYVENVAFGHLLLEEKMLDSQSVDQVSGQAFLISNGEPCSRGYFYTLHHVFNPSTKINIMPVWFISILASFSELVQNVFKGKYSLGKLDQLTPPVVWTCVTDITHTHAKAARLLGYKPLYTVSEGVQKAAALFHAQQEERKTK